MFKEDPCRSLTGEVRLSYVNLNQPKAPQTPGQEACYSVAILIPKTDVATKADIENAIAAATTAAVNKKWHGVRPPFVPSTLHDGDGTKTDGTPYGAECKGMWILNAKRYVKNGKPWICDVSNIRIELPPQEIYSGMYARCIVSFYGYTFAGKKGIGCQIDNVMKIRDGEALGGAITPSADDLAQFENAVDPITGQPRINPITGQPM